MGDVELVGLYWTLSGPVEVHVGREWSTFDWRDRCDEAAKVGFSGIGIWHADLEHVLERRSLREMKEIFDAAGLKHLELEFLMDWFLDPGDASSSRPPPSWSRTTSRSATSRRRRPRSSRSRSASPSCVRTPPTTTRRRSPTRSCRSTRTSRASTR
jgi:hypothetical protein